MNNLKNFTEWTKEQKDELAERRMQEMKEKNEQIKKRYAEVQSDRIAAENKNSAVTAIIKTKDKKKEVYGPKLESKREWDRGKGVDYDNWQSPEPDDSFSGHRTGRYERNDRGTWGSYTRNDDDSWHDQTFAGHHEKKDFDRRDNWGRYSRNDGDNYRSDRVSDRRVRGSYRQKQHDDTRTMPRLQGGGYKNTESQRRSQHSYSDEKYRRSDYNRANSRKRCPRRGYTKSSSQSDSDYKSKNVTSIKLSLWRNDRESEDQNKQNRTKDWVTDVNNSLLWPREKSPEQEEKGNSKPYSKFDRFEHSPDCSSDEDISKEIGPNKKSNFTSRKLDNCENKCQSRSTLTSNVVPSPVKQNNDGLKKGFKTKRSPQYNSAGTGKTEHFRKHGRFDNQGFKNKDEKFTRSKIHNKGDAHYTAYNSLPKKDVHNNKDEQKLKSSYKHPNTNDADTWDPNLSWGPVDQSHDDDGIWGATKQPDISWKLNEEEGDVKNENSKSYNVSIDKWNDNEISNVEKNCKVKERYAGENKNKKMDSANYKDDDMWDNVKQDGAAWNLSDDETKAHNENETSKTSFSNQDKLQYNVQQSKGKMMDGWNIHSSSTNIHKTNYKPVPVKIAKKPLDDGKIPGGSDDRGWSTVGEQGDVLSDADAKDVQNGKFPGGSDDGGWSTVSEQGDVLSDTDAKDVQNAE